jgi:glyoxylase-like metal-dependent hydrolase (beta-lactamase superfamily II)
MRLGELEILPVLDGAMDVPVDVMLNQVPHARWLTPEGLMPVQMGGYLVKSGARVILVDTGFGQGTLLASLAGLGVQPAQVTDVVLTHLHFDHIGWASDGTTSTFPSATYRCDVRDWQHFVVEEHDEYMRDLIGAMTPKDRLMPVVGQLELFEGDTALAPGVDLRAAPGHTPGSTVVVLSSGTDRAMLLGDVVHCPAEMMSQDWEMLADVDPHAAARTREALAKEIEGSGTLVGAAHFPGLRMGRLLSSGSGERDWAYQS